MPQAVVPDVRLGMSLAAAALAGHPSRDLMVVGVTGTNGKTTSTFLVRAILEAAGLPCGLVGTIEARVGGAAVPLRHTTPDAIQLQELFARMRDAGDRACAMEVSSHALAQRRTAGTRFAAALFTNLTRDHLDYHEGVEEYYLAKRALFLRPEAEGDDPPGAANLDDELGRRLAARGGRARLRRRRAGARCARCDARGLGTGIAARIATPRGTVEVESRLRGRFNLANIAGAVAVGELLGLPHEAVAAGIASLRRGARALRGGRRRPALPRDRRLRAHARLARERAAGGPRAGGRGAADLRVRVRRRPRPGQAAPDGRRGRGARRRRGRHLGQPALRGARGDHRRDPGRAWPTARRRTVVEPDRRAAIAWAAGESAPGDVVVIAGKGHEQGQERKGVVTPFDDRVVAREAIGGVAGGRAGA